MAFRSLIQAAGNTALKEKLMMTRSTATTLQNPSCRRCLGTATIPKQMAYSPTTAAEQQVNRSSSSSSSSKQQGKGKDYVPVYVSVGLIALAVVFGVHTMKQQLMHGPSVSVKKSKRETVAEVEQPDQAADQADKFVKNSFFRKVAHVQEFDSAVPDNVRGDILTRKPRVETLKSVGVDPAKAET